MTTDRTPINSRQMVDDDNSVVFDITFLWEASRRIHGYFMHTWFEHYLVVIMNNVRRWVGQGVVGADARPSKETDYRLLFDLNALDFEKLSYLVGIYMYVLSSHKWSNYYLMNDTEKKWVLYLRGYDFEGSVAPNEADISDVESDMTPEEYLLRSIGEVASDSGVAVGFSSTHTSQFNTRLEDLIADDFHVFKVLSPRDLYWETIGPQRYFYGDYDGLIASSNRPLHSVFLNGRRWKADITEFADRIDHFVVYVSSITDSALWELELLKRKGRDGDVTVVFDESAISNKELQAGLQRFARSSFRGGVRWTKEAVESDTLTTDDLRERLAEDFVVVSPDDFADHISDHKARIMRSESPAGLDGRQGPIMFEFYPAVSDDELARIREFDRRLASEIHNAVTSQTITNLPWLTNQVQLRVFTSLMLGDHDETGRALAVYAAIMNVTGRQLAEDVESSDASVSEEVAGSAAALIDDHFAFSRYAAPTLMGFGRSHEFGSYIESARSEYNELFSAASAAVAQFYEEADQIRGA